MPPEPPVRTVPRAASDAALVAGALALCPLTAALAPTDPSGPVARAQALVELERGLGLFVEPAMHAWATDRPTLLAAALVFYVMAHLPITVGALVWAWLERPSAFPLVRNVFLVAQALTVAGYLVLPTAPPRLVAGLGFSDTLSAFWGVGAAGAAHTVQSPYAAVPSGHVVFALVAAGAVALLARPLVVKALACAYPPLVVAVTMLTANHVWFDAVAALAVVVVAVGVVLAGPAVLRRLREAATIPLWPRLGGDGPPVAR